MPDSYLAFISFGSSLGSIPEQIMRLTTAREHINTQLAPVIYSSSLYTNPPAGGVARNNFINSACAIHTQHSPVATLRFMLDLETTLGRHRTSGVSTGEDRCLDLDILLIFAIHPPHHLKLIEISSTTLHVPHPRLTQRSFMWWPLIEVIDSPPLDYLNSKLKLNPKPKSLLQPLWHQVHQHKIAHQSNWFYKKCPW